jgi:D-aspartate ligase
MDADYRGLAVVRSLGRRGIPVWVLQHGDQLLATLSRYNRRTLSWPSQDEEEKVNFLVNLADRENIRDWALFPTGDEGAALVARHHKMLGEHFQLTTPPWDVLQWCYDKRLAYRLADRVGIDHPWTLYPRNSEQVAASDCPYPVILKPAYCSSFNRFTASKAWRIDNREQLLARYDEAKTLVDPGALMIQEVIPGGGESQFSYTALCQDGRPIASLTARRARQIPWTLGVPALSLRRSTTQQHQRPRFASSRRCDTQASWKLNSNEIRVTVSLSYWTSTRVFGAGTVSVDRRGWIIPICCGS